MSSGVEAVRPAKQADEARVVESLSLAFDADAAFNWGLRQDAGRAQAFRFAFRTIFRRYLAFGATFVVGDGAGSALWARSDQWEVPLWRELLHRHVAEASRRMRVATASSSGRPIPGAAMTETVMSGSDIHEHR